MAVYDSPHTSSVPAAKFPGRHLRCCWLILLALISSSSAAHADETIDSAWKGFSRSDPGPAIEFLETAVLKAPERADYWAALVSLLSETALDRGLITCYTQAALHAHPDSLEVHWARLRCLRPEVALDELSALAAREPDKQKLRDAREILEMSLRLPRDWQTGQFYEEWAVKCLAFQNHESAARAAKRGLELLPKSKLLRTVEATAFVHQEKYELAFAALNQAKFEQALNNGKLLFPTVGDLLLSKKQPEWAVRAFGPKPDEDLVRGRQGLVLAQALLQSNKLERAEEVFSQTDPLGASLLVIGNLLDLKQTASAREVAEQLFDNWPAGSKEYSHAKDMRWSGNWPVALEPQFKRAIAWLWKTYPQHKDLLNQHLATPDELFQHEPMPVKLRSMQDVWKSGQLAGKAPGEYVPGYGWYEAGPRETYDYFRRVLLEPPREKARIRTNLRPAQHWADSLRETRAIAYYSTHPRELFRARRLVEQLKHLQVQESERAAELISVEVRRMNPVVRALLFKALAAHDENARDKTPVVQLLAAHGTQADVPDLLSALKESTNNPNEPAFHEALEKITGVQNTGKSYADRILFWEAWWQANLVRVIAETEF